MLTNNNLISAAIMTMAFIAAAMMNLYSYCLVCLSNLEIQSWVAPTAVDAKNLPYRDSGFHHDLLQILFERKNIENCKLTSEVAIGSNLQMMKTSYCLNGCDSFVVNFKNFKTF